MTSLIETKLTSYAKKALKKAREIPETEYIDLLKNNKKWKKQENHQ